MVLAIAVELHEDAGVLIRVASLEVTVIVPMLHHRKERIHQEDCEDRAFCTLDLHDSTHG